MVHCSSDQNANVLSRVLTRPVGETRRRISGVGGVAI